MESLHPLVVHFPIALLLSAVGLELLALLLKRPALHRISLWNLCLGTLGAAAAVLTGLRAEVAGLRTELRSFELRTEKRFEEQSRQWELAMEVRERLAALEAQVRHR